MSPLEISILIICILCLIIIFLFLFGFSIRKKHERLISNQIKSCFFNEEIHLELSNKSPYQFKIETKDCIYLVKVIHFHSSYELIITNPNFWCINSNPKNWKRSSVPVLVEGVKAFQNISLTTNKKVIKAAIIYPDCYNILMYLNESDVELVTYKKQAYGVYFVLFNEIDLFFRK